MSRRSKLLLLAVVLGLAMILLLVGRRERAGGARTPRHLVILSLDTTRADMWGFNGNTWIRTPEMDRLAAESVVLDDLMTVVPTTLASHTSLFTGKYPLHHGVPMNGYIVNEDNLMLAEILRGKGFRTFGFAGSFALDSRFGIAQGFEIYDANFDIPLSAEIEQTQRRGDAVTDAVIHRLEEVKSAEGRLPERMFLFAHYFDPHHPYDAPEPFGSMYAGRFGAADHAARGDLVCGEATPPGAVNEPRRNPEAYAGEISYLDSELGRLLDHLRAEGILDDALLLIVSDHGESFWEHVPHFHHGRGVWQAAIHAVGLMRFPGGRHAGMRYRALAATPDLLPTVLRELGIRAPAGIDGEAMDFARPEGGAKRTRFAEASQAPQDITPDADWVNRPKSKCIRRGRHKYIWTPYLKADDGAYRTEEMYDIDADPCEQNNLLAGATPEILKLRAELRGELEAWSAGAAPLKSEFDRANYEETTRKLEAIGYFDRPKESSP